MKVLANWSPTLLFNIALPILTYVLLTGYGLADAPALETRLIASGAELPQLAMKRAAMRAKIKKEVRTDPLTEGADCDMLGILFLDPRWRSPATRLAGFPGPNL